MRKIETWEDLVEELIESDYDLEENVIVPFEGTDYIFDNEQFDYYRKEYGHVVLESIHHPILEHLLEYKFLIRK